MSQLTARVNEKIKCRVRAQNPPTEHSTETYAHTYDTHMQRHHTHATNIKGEDFLFHTVSMQR